jgi:hypothetical protein
MLNEAKARKQFAEGDGINPVRWKLLLVVSIVGGLLALGLWSILAVAIFGSARVMAQEDWRLLVSLVIPLAVTILATIFVYRHTSRRRKLQALLACGLVLLFTAFSYLIASSLFVSRLCIPTTYEVRHAK